MLTTVRWREYRRDELHSCGRNGIAKQTGVILFGFDKGGPAKVSIDPINSSGARSKGCSIEIPVEAIGEVIAALKQLEAHLTQTAAAS